MTGGKENSSVRIDKWLWAARFFKTRALSREMVQSGKVQYNGARSKPSKLVEIGGLVSIPQGYDTKEVLILGLSEKRQSAPIAQTLYEETPASIEKRKQNKISRSVQGFHSPKPEQRPDKKQRRELIKFKQR